MVVVVVNGADTSSSRESKREPEKAFCMMMTVSSLGGGDDDVNSPQENARGLEGVLCIMIPCAETISSCESTREKEDGVPVRCVMDGAMGRCADNGSSS